MSTITARMQQRFSTAAEWAATNPILLAGEIGVDTTNNQLRVGNGVSPWGSLTPYYPGQPSGGTGTGGKGPSHISIAAVNSPSLVKARADYQCDGINDADIINNAIRNANNQISGGTGGNKFGSIVLADGVYLLNKPILIPGKGFTISGQGRGTVLLKASSFTNGGQGTTPALIKMDTSVAAQKSSGITIRNMTLCGRHFGNLGSGAPSGSPIAGIWLDIAGPTNERELFGLPHYLASGDNSSVIENCLVFDTTTGIYWTSTNGARGVQVKDTEVLTFQAGGSGIHISASDAKVSNCTAAGAQGANSIGFNINGGNSLLIFCKAFYMTGSGGIGFNVSSSRVSVTGCEAQDNNTGFKVAASQSKLSSCRVDNQVAGMNTGIDLQPGSKMMVNSTYIQCRNEGTYLRGINLNDTSQGVVDVIVDPAGITTAVTKGTGFTAVTTNAGLPTALEATIVRMGQTTLRNAT